MCRPTQVPMLAALGDGPAVPKPGAWQRKHLSVEEFRSHPSSGPAPRATLGTTLAVWLWLGWIANYYAIAALAAVLAHLRCRVLLAVLVGFVAFLLILPRKAGCAFLVPTLGKWIARRAADYFAMRMVYEDEGAIREATTPMIFALEPHGVLPVSMLGFHDSLEWVPGHKCSGLMTSAVFGLPGMKSVFTILSAETVDRQTFSRLLSSGRSCCFCPGGVQEVMHMRNADEIVLFLRSRLGFARLALRHRTPVSAATAMHLHRESGPGFLCGLTVACRASEQAVPCFTFGLQGIYSYCFAQGSLAGKVARRIGFLPGAYWGLGGLPFGPPRPKALTTIVGRPVPIPAGLPDGAEASQESVDAYHAAFLTEMERIFEENKGSFGLSATKLRII